MLSVGNWIAMVVGRDARLGTLAVLPKGTYEAFTSQYVNNTLKHLRACAPD